jgi:hypothetical protein
MAYKKFTLLYLAILLCAGILLLPALLLLRNSYEVSGADKLVRMQKERNAIYAAALDHNAIRYKLALIERDKPQVVALGSSRVMQFREEFFTVPFVNAGGALASAQDMQPFVERMLAIHKPDVVMLGVDFWWLNPNRKHSSRKIQNDLGQINIRTMMGAVKHLWQKQGGRLMALRLLSGQRNIIHPHSQLSVMGLEALTSSDGYRPDGSRLYYGYVSGHAEHGDAGFDKTKSRIATGGSRFEYADALDQRQLDSLQDSIRFLEDAGVKVIVFLPPLAHPVWADLAARTDSAYKFIAALDLGAPDYGWYNYHDPQNLTPDVCEFFDGFHGGDVLHQRMLLDMSKTQPALGSVLDIDSLTQNVVRYAGLTTTKTDKFPMNEVVEGDFLQMGCDKIVAD